MAGGGSCRPALERLRSDLGLDGVVELAGPVLDVTSSLDRIDLFLATSASEPYGIAAVEAMARRVPVVAMPCPGGLAELVGEAGLLLDDRRIETATAAIRGLLSNDDARDRAARAGRSAGRAQHARGGAAAVAADLSGRVLSRPWPVLLLPSEPSMQRRLRMGMVGGGRGAFIGAVHRMAAALDGSIELVCGAFSSDPDTARASGRDLSPRPRIAATGPGAR